MSKCCLMNDRMWDIRPGVCCPVELGDQVDLWTPTRQAPRGACVCRIFRWTLCPPAVASSNACHDSVIAGQHDHRVGTVQDRVGHVGGLGPGSAGVLDHRVQHLGRRDDGAGRFPGPSAPHASAPAEPAAAAARHQSIAGDPDPVKGANDRPRSTSVGDRNVGQRDHVDTQRERGLHVNGGSIGQSDRHDAWEGRTHRARSPAGSAPPARPVRFLRLGERKRAGGHDWQVRSACEVMRQAAVAGLDDRGQA